MFGLALLVASIAFADSLNPSTVLPALYLSTGEHAVRKLAAFAAGVFAVSFLAGVAVVAGPGQLILGGASHLPSTTKHVVEICVGVALLALAPVFLRKGEALTRRIPTGSSRRGSFALGAAIMAVEIPTAFPYFAAIAAIVGSGSHLITQLGYVVLFNAVFVLPVLAIMALRMLATPGAERRVEAVGAWVRRYAHRAVALIAGIVGLAFLVVGVAGIV